MYIKGKDHTEADVAVLINDEKIVVISCNSSLGDDGKTNVTEFDFDSAVLIHPANILSFKTLRAVGSIQAVTVTVGLAILERVIPSS